MTLPYHYFSIPDIKKEIQQQLNARGIEFFGLIESLEAATWHAEIMVAFCRWHDPLPPIPPNYRKYPFIQAARNLPTMDTQLEAVYNSGEDNANDLAGRCRVLVDLYSELMARYELFDWRKYNIPKLNAEAFEDRDKYIGPAEKAIKAWDKALKHVQTEMTLQNQRERERAAKLAKEVVRTQQDRAQQWSIQRQLKRNLLEEMKHRAQLRPSQLPSPRRPSGQSHSSRSSGPYCSARSDISRSFHSSFSSRSHSRSS